MNRPTILLSLALSAPCAMIGCEQRQQAAAAAPAEKPPAAVMAAAAVARDVPVYLDEIGKTVARASVMIQPQVTGKVTEVHFTDGADVKKGDLLFTIDPRPFQAVLAQADASVAQAKANVKWAQAEVQRFKEVSSSGAVSRTEIEQKQNALDVALATQTAAEAAVEKAKLDVEYCTIRSPIDGRASKRLVDPGNVVSASGPNGGTSLLLIQSLDPIYADFTVTENELGTVRKFMAEGVIPTQDPQGHLKVFVDIPADARSVVQALSGAAPTTKPTTKTSGPREGQLTFLDNIVQESAGTVRCRATLPNRDRYFWPGQFVKCRLVLTIKSNAVLVPASAIQIGQQGLFVLVIKPDSTAEIRNVVTGQRQGDMMVVDQGVAAGEQVITQGQMMVFPGSKVQVIPNAPAGAPGAPAASQAVAQGEAKS